MDSTCPKITPLPAKQLISMDGIGDLEFLLLEYGSKLKLLCTMIPKFKTSASLILPSQKMLPQ